MSEPKAKDEKTLEESFDSLNSVVDKLENGNLSLEDSFVVYQEGMELLKECDSKIDTVEKKMMKLNENGEISEF